jgi:hypothetical protein
VTIITGIARRNMIGIFADRIVAIVTAEAIAAEISMVKICRQPGRSGVAIVTIVATCNVRRVLSVRDCSVMTRRARADDLGVINPVGRRPERNVMAILANIGRQDMIDIFASCVRTVVAAEAISSEIGMVKIRGHPGYCRVAVVTIFATGYMRGVFTFCDCSVMA